MSFRTKVLLIVVITVIASVTVVAYGVTYYTRTAFEELDTERTNALVAQFKKEFEQQGKEVARQVENITNAEATLRMALDLARPNADQSLYVHDATGAAQDHGLDYVEFVGSDGTIVSSAQYPARVGYKNDWVTAQQDWHGTPAFLMREELPDRVELSLTVVRALPVTDKVLYVIGGKRLDQEFLQSLVLPDGMRALLYRNLDRGYNPASLSDKDGPITNADRFQSMIEQMQKNPEPLVRTIRWTNDAASAETFHTIPLLSRKNELLGVLLVGSSRRELVLLMRHIMWTSAAVAGAALVIGLLLTMWVSSRISKPIEELAVGARDVAGGNWDTRIELKGRDEIGELASAFNHMTETLAAQKERLVQTERVAAWRELARRLAHELRNPLFPLQITVENMQRAKQLGAEQFLEVFNESTATLKAELANLNTIVGRFSDFSKMPPPQFSKVNVNEAIRAVIRLFEPQFHEVGKPTISTEMFLAEDLQDIEADPDLLHKAFQNLVLNALDAMPAGGTLMLRTAQEPGGVRIEVSDTGKGLTPEECSRLFTPYYTTKQQGTGLGLAIVQSVVSDHHGTISVTSEQERGTTFRIELPQRQAAGSLKSSSREIEAKMPPQATAAGASD